MMKPYREEFESLGETCHAVAMREQTGGAQFDRRLEPSATAAGLGENFPSAGGFAVAESFAAEIWQGITDEGFLLGKMFRQPVSTDRLRLPFVDEASRADGSRLGGVRFYWLDEGEAPTATKPKWGAMTLTPRKAMVVIYVTGEMFADVPALDVILRKLLVQESIFVLEDLAINGFGTTTPLGVLNSGALVTVTPESGHAAATITPTDLKMMMARFWPASHARGVWLMSLETFGEIADVSFSNGQPVVQYVGNRRFILGCELRIVEYTAALGTVGDVILMDPGEYILAERDVNFVSSLHVSFLAEECAFRFRLRVDGQPGWKAPVVPRNCTASASPFIVLGAR